MSSYDETRENHGELKKVLKPIHLLAIAVGLVISGDFYGFSYGYETGGPVSLLISFIPVTILYVTFLLCYTELATSIPHDEGRHRVPTGSRKISWKRKTA